jgi:ABC-type dipeptide/oligopeptide/nickel transport system ATPase component
MLSVMRLLATSATTRGSVCFNGKDLFSASNREMREIRGGKIGMIFQDPMTSLNPSFRIGSQIAEVIIRHQHVSTKSAVSKATDLLEVVSIPRPSESMSLFPHEMSGGMKQRVMIAMAIANDPELLIADEPTTALDVTIQAQILEVLKGLRETRNLSIVIITHDLGVVAGLADSVNVMYAGEIVESGDVEGVFYNSTHPYSRGLLSCVPRLDIRESALHPIGGDPPKLSERTPGCSFQPRCKNAIDLCETTSPILRASTVTGLKVSCHNPMELSSQMSESI